ncbi:MAG: hypothetical protein KME29_02590 [Calothrix sp. FI2-JRJ7]|jgi:hypothetical protein|nr:hypothetical protein [Calothrix sp. FI2-JRJ7]
MNSYSNVKTPFGNPLITDKDGQTVKNVQLELLTQKIRYLEQVKELTAMYGAERVLEFMQLGGFILTAPDSESIGTASSDTKSQEDSGADLIEEVEALGLELNPQLINLIAKSAVQHVKTAIAKYKTYRQVTNPEGLFYRILSNEHK